MPYTVTDRPEVLGAPLPRWPLPPLPALSHTIYLATPYGNARKIKQQVPLIEQAGHRVLARWLDMDPAQRPPMVPGPEWSRYARQVAQMDLEDLVQASLVILDLTGDLRSITGGCFVEYGIAMARGQHVWIVGKLHNVFCHLPAAEHYSNWRNVLVDLRRLTTPPAVANEPPSMRGD